MNPNPPTSLSSEALQILIDEAGRLQTLYLDARSSAQNVFNFYLTFVTAVVGGLVIVGQNGLDTVQNQLMLTGLLLFAVLTGSVYLGAMSARYAQASRYAWGLDAVRRELLKQIPNPLPNVYHTFMQVQPTPKQAPWYIWLVATGTYALFIALVNGVAMGMVVWLLLSLGDVTIDTKLMASAVTTLITLTVLNMYSRLVLNRFSHALDVRVDMGETFILWASRQ